MGFAKAFLSELEVLLEIMMRGAQMSLVLQEERLALLRIIEDLKRKLTESQGLFDQFMKNAKKAAIGGLWLASAAAAIFLALKFRPKRR